MNRGYVKVWRKIQDNGILRNHKYCTFFLWALTKASHRQINIIIGCQPIILEPGQFIFGRRMAAEELGMTEREIRTCLEIAKKADFLTIKTTNKFSIITIINWHIYQGADSGKRPAKRPAGDQQATTNKNDKNEKNLFRQNSLTVLSYLNEKTGKRFRDTSHIEARLKDGGTVDDCLRIIDAKLRDPYFRENPRYLNPRTLFRPSHWDSYLNEATEPTQRPETPGNACPLTCPGCGRSVLSSDLDGEVCIRCASQGAAHA